MAPRGDSQTSTTLLRRLRCDPTDQAAWGEFVDRYGRMIFRWCRRWGLQEADAEDVTQNVLLELARQMRTFEYDRAGSFRGWLRTIAYRSWYRFTERRRPVGGDDLLQSQAVRDDFIATLERESERELLERAMGLVRLRVQTHTWEAFRLMALEQLSGAEVASRLGIKVGTVFVARSKVQKMLREEVQRLNGGED